MICLFVHFVMANSVFMHTHIGVDGSAVTHSHPYLPGSGHSHTSQAMTAIGSFNAAASGIEGASGTVLPPVAAEWHKVHMCLEPGVPSVSHIAAGERGPPECILYV